MCFFFFIYYNKSVVIIVCVFSLSVWNIVICDLDVLILINLGFYINDYVFIYVYVCILL